jgi:NAD(P)H-nitrite reductase large subunit
MIGRRKKSTPEQGRQYLIIGNSAAGIAAAREIRRRDERGRITLLSDEPTLGYSRVMLPLYIAGKIHKREMVIAPRDDYARLKIKLLRGDPVESIDPKEQRVFSRKGIHFPYDQLLVATGASPRTLNIPGKDLPGIHYLRKIDDAEGIRKGLSSSPGPVLVIGGGLVSVKSLEALLLKKRKVHMAISSNRILSQMLDETASGFFLDALRKRGVSVHLQTDVLAFEGKERIEGARLSDGTFFPCSLAIIGKGVKPNVGLLEGTGIQLNEGVVVDPHMATNLPFIYAAGDVAETFDLLRKKHQGQAIWPLAVEGGRVAGSNMASIASIFPGGLRMNAVELLGIKAVSVGAKEGQNVLTYLPPCKSIYRRLSLSGGRLTGFLLAGDIRCAGILTSLVKNGTPVSSSVLEEGLERGFSYSPRLRALQGEVSSGVFGGG